MGLLVYGHRGARAPGGRCQDIEVVVPTGYNKAQTVKNVLAGIQARGTTPLCNALKLAAQHVAVGSIVLISDGTEDGEDVD